MCLFLFTSATGASGIRAVEQKGPPTRQYSYLFALGNASVFCTFVLVNASVPVKRLSKGAAHVETLVERLQRENSAVDAAADLSSARYECLFRCSVHTKLQALTEAVRGEASAECVI